MRRLKHTVRERGNLLLSVFASETSHLADRAFLSTHFSSCIQSFFHIVNGNECGKKQTGVNKPNTP